VNDLKGVCPTKYRVAWPRDGAKATELAANTH